MIPKLNLRHSVSETRKISVFDTSDLQGTKVNRVCVICTEKRAAYTCPRCFVVYCSLSCYKRHNKGICTEEMAKDKVREVLEAEKQEKAEATNDYDSKPSSATIAAQIAEKLEQFDFDVTLLSLDERAHLRRMASAGLLDGALNLRRPWWVHHPAHNLLQGSRQDLSVNASETGCHMERLGDDRDADGGDDEWLCQVRPLITGNRSAFETEMAKLGVLVRRHCTQSRTATESIVRAPSAPLALQLFDFLVGYSVMMRCMDGTWADRETVPRSEISSASGSTTSIVEPTASLHTCGEAVEGAVEAMEVLLAHSRMHARDFRPLTLTEAVGQGAPQLKRSPLVVAGGLEGVYRDVDALLASPSATCYAVLDGWCLSLVVSRECDVDDVYGVASGGLPRAQFLGGMLEAYAPLVGKPEKVRTVTPAALLSRKLYFMAMTWTAALCRDDSSDEAAVGKETGMEIIARGLVENMRQEMRELGLIQNDK